MRILDKIEEYQPSGNQPLVLAIGNFDGVHIGHQQLLKKILDGARGGKGRAAVFTFRQHPQHILHPSSKPPLLTSLNHKLYLLEKSGVEICFLLPFTPEFSQMEPEFFVREWLVKKLRVSEVYLGYNAHFGRDRGGDSALMKTLAAKYGFYYEEESPVSAGSGFVSSSRIRDLVREGRLEEAEICLGRPFSVFGKVKRGAGRGAKLGFPTANFEIENEIMPPLGVYPVMLRKVTIARSGADFKPETGEELCGILNYGYRPTFGETPGQAVPEVFIFDFDADIYEERFEISFFSRLRGETVFKNADELKAQISKDIEAAKSFFHNRPGKEPLQPFYRND